MLNITPRLKKCTLKNQHGISCQVMTQAPEEVKYQDFQIFFHLAPALFFQQYKTRYP